MWILFMPKKGAFMMNWLELIVFLSSFFVVVVAFFSFEFSKTPTPKYAASYPSYLLSSHTSFLVLLSSQFPMVILLLRFYAYIFFSRIVPGITWPRPNLTVKPLNDDSVKQVIIPLNSKKSLKGPFHPPVPLKIHHHQPTSSRTCKTNSVFQ